MPQNRVKIECKMPQNRVKIECKIPQNRVKIECKIPHVSYKSPIKLCSFFSQFMLQKKAVIRPAGM